MLLIYIVYLVIRNDREYKVYNIFFFFDFSWLVSVKKIIKELNINILVVFK